MNLSKQIVGVIGLGYVGLPLAVEFARTRPVVGFDILDARIADLKNGLDLTQEIGPEELAAARHLEFSSDTEQLKKCGIFIVTVPTPIDSANRPNLGPLKAASKTVGKALSRGDVVIYESTVYPGCSREMCVPILESESGLTFNKDFFVGYSPERINPGDKEHRLPDIVKVTSGSTPQAALAIDELYKSIITAGTHRASSIEVAEAAKVIENTQRDLNIALMNELAVIFGRLDIDTNDVLAAAATKWNFLPFRPGLVGGHCIGVDPYYLTHKAQEIGYHPEVILAGRRINDGMGSYVADQVVKLMLKRGHGVAGARALMMGLSFKENCPDVRNSRAVDIIQILAEYNMKVDVYDPWVNREDAMMEFGVELIKELEEAPNYDCVIIAVGHQQFIELGIEAITGLSKPQAVIYDVKGVFSAEHTAGRL